MYNQEQKQKYLDYMEANSKKTTTTISTFKSIAPCEEKWGADISTRSTEEIQAAIDKMFGSRRASKASRISNLRMYVRWCIDNNMPGACDGMLNVRVNVSANQVACAIKCPADLQSALNRLFRPERDNTVDNVYRCYMWLAYMGVNNSDTINIRTQDVDIANLCIRVGNDTYPMINESIPSIVKCATLDRFRFIHPAYSIELDRYPGDKLLRVIKGDASLETLNGAIIERHIDTGKEDPDVLALSYRAVRDAGYFYNLYNLEKSGLELDFRAIARAEVAKRIEDGELKEEYKTSYARRLKEDIQKGYNQWKNSQK